jgi:flagellar protein FlaE
VKTRSFDQSAGRRAERNGRTSGHGSDAAEKASRLEALFLAQAGREGGRPHLDAVPDHYAAEIIVFDWLAYLLERGGFKGAMEAIRYYRNAGWYGEAVESQLLDYLRGLPADDGHGDSLSVADHQDSLVYLSRLAALS